MTDRPEPSPTDRRTGPTRHSIQREQRAERKWRRHEVLNRMKDIQRRFPEKADALFERVSKLLDEAGVPVVIPKKEINLERKS